MKQNRRFLMFVFVLFLLPEVVGGQLSLKYETELMKYLNPPFDSSRVKEIAFFMGDWTAPNPEYSIRIVGSKNSSWMEARILDSSLLMKHSNYKVAFLKGCEDSTFSIGTFTYKRLITEALKARVLSAFNKVITFNDPVDHTRKINADGTITVMIYDGPTYSFSINGKDYKQAKIQYGLESTDFRQQTIDTLLQMVHDLKSNTFEESRYFTSY